jgi:IS4 transposase
VRVVDYAIANRATNHAGKPTRNGQPIPDGESIRLITTILDPTELTAPELAAAYQQRWEHESVLDELKTHLRGRGEVLRSKSPELVEQELLGLLLAHYAVRELMCQAADQVELDPDRLSLLRAVRLTRRQVTDQAAFSP